jgi:PPOX class probable F420-dependent enzyme
MHDDEVRAFLTALPARPAIRGTVRADGRPHVAPIWYAVDDDDTILFNTGENTVKGRNLRRAGWAAMSVDDDAAPFSFVTLEGPVTISDDLADVRHWAGVIGGRYKGADRTQE